MVGLPCKEWDHSHVSGATNGSFSLGWLRDVPGTIHSIYSGAQGGMGEHLCMLVV